MAIIYSIQGKPILVDDANYEWLNQHRWSINKGYAYTSGPRSDRKSTHRTMHRMIMDCPQGFMVDHLNHIRHDNRRENLRIVTAYENQKNRLPDRRRKFDAKTGKYWLLRGYELVGMYDTKDEQLKAYREMAINGNKPTVTSTSIPID